MCEEFTIGFGWVSDYVYIHIYTHIHTTENARPMQTRITFDIQVKIKLSFKDHRVIRQVRVTVPTNGPRSPRTPFMPRFPEAPWNKNILLDILAYSIAVHLNNMQRCYTQWKHTITVYLYSFQGFFERYSLQLEGNDKKYW